MSTPLTRAELDQTKCNNPGCDHTAHDSGLLLLAGCHPHAGVVVLYRLGVLTISCNECQKLAAEIEVAP